MRKLMISVALSLLSGCASGLHFHLHSHSPMELPPAPTTETDEESSGSNVKAEGATQVRADTPMALQAISSDSMARLNVKNFDDLLKYTPKVHTNKIVASSHQQYICIFAGQQRLGVDHPTCDAIKDQLKANGCFYFSPYEEMLLYEPKEVSAWIEVQAKCPPNNGIAAEKRNKAPTGHQVDLTVNVYAELQGDSALKIEPSGSRRLNLYERPDLTWKWTVTPLRTTPQNQPLHMTLLSGVEVKMPDGSVQRFGNDPLPKEVTVIVTPPQRVRSALDVIRDWALAIGATLGAVTGVILAMVHLRNAESKLFRRTKRGQTAKNDGV